MSRSTARAIAGLAVCGVVVTGCADDPKTEPAAETATFDQSLHDRLPRDIREAGAITFATDASYAPAASFAPDGRTIVGFEPDLAAAMGTVLGVRVEMVVTDFEAAPDVVVAHDVDAVMSAMTDTPEREEKLDFVNYFSAGSSIVVQRGNPHGIADLDDLCGHVVAVESATVQVDLLERTQPHCGRAPIDVRTFATNDDALVELRTGRATAVLNDYPQAVHLTTNERTQADYQLAADIQYEPGLYGIGVAKDQPQLRDALKATLERLQTTGVYEQVLQAWDVQDGAIRTISVNGARRLDG